MKNKILSIIFAVLLLIPCFSLSASAITERTENGTYCGISISEDYKTLYYKGTVYERFDSSMTEWEYENNFYNIKYNSNEIDYVDYDIGLKAVIITANIYLTDGSNFGASYIDANYMAEHRSLITNASEYDVEFSYSSNYTVILPANVFHGEATTLSNDKIRFSDFFDTNAASSNNSFSVKKGVVVLSDDTYYYVDFFENGIKSSDDFFTTPKEDYIAHKITDSDAISSLNDAYKEYSSDGLNFLGNDFTAGIGIVLLCIVFGVLPLAALIVFLILSIRAKAPPYKKMFRIVWLLSAAELVLFVVVTLLLTLLK